MLLPVSLPFGFDTSPYLEHFSPYSMAFLPVLVLPPILSFFCALAVCRTLADAMTTKAILGDKDTSGTAKDKRKLKAWAPFNLALLVALQCLPLIAGCSTGALFLAALKVCPNASLSSLVLVVGALASIPAALALKSSDAAVPLDDRDVPNRIMASARAAQDPPSKTPSTVSPSDDASTAMNHTDCARDTSPSGDDNVKQHDAAHISPFLDPSSVEPDCANPAGGTLRLVLPPKRKDVIDETHVNPQDQNRHQTPSATSPASSPDFTFPVGALHSHLMAATAQTISKDGSKNSIANANKNTHHRSTASEPHALAHTISARGQPHLSPGASLAPILTLTSPGAMTSFETDSTVASSSPAPTVTPPRSAALSVTADYLALEDEFVRLLLSSAAKAVKQSQSEHSDTEIPFKPWPKEWPVYWEGAGLGAW